MIMKFSLYAFFVLFYSTLLQGQADKGWYNQSENDGVIIQNSYPKGGPYTGIITKNFNHSYLVFFSRVVNNTDSSIELKIDFSAESIQIPNSPNTFMQLFLPPDTMTIDKQRLFSYGVTELESFEKPTNFSRIIKPSEDCLFYVVAIFHQTQAEAINQPRGGNRAELILKGRDLFYRIPPQIESMQCGKIILRK